LLVNVIMIGRSGVAMAAELASMSVNGDVKTLDMQGMDPMVYLVMPRVVAAGIAVFCMTVVFVLIAFASGYWCGSLLGMMPAPDIFLNGVFNAVTRADGPSFLAKTLIPGMLTAGIACTEGLGIRGQLTEIPQAAARAVVRAMVAMALVSALISTVTYV